MKRVFQLYDDPEKTAEAAKLAEKNNLCVSAVSPVFPIVRGTIPKRFGEMQIDAYGYVD
jgi:hypothetical protein